MKKQKAKSKTRKIHLMTGNEAIGEAAVRAGCELYAGYPITPQNELTAFMAGRMTEVGRAFVQSESEIAAINMVFGASVVGARSMTSSSSPGISLKQEGISYLAACRLPAVIINVMRGGPGLGNIAPSQADYFQATKGGGHGDYHLIVLAPASAQEAMDFTVLSFELSDKYRCPAMVLADGMLGQMMEPVELADLASTKKIAAMRNRKKWALTGAKARAPRCVKSLFLKEGSLEALNELLQKTYAEIKKNEVRSESLYTKDADLIVVAYGSISRMAKAAVKDMRQEKKRIGLFRPITLWPFPEKELRGLSSKGKRFLVMEMSTGQMVEDVRLSVDNKSKVYFYGRPGGSVPTKEEIEKEIQKVLRIKGKA